MKKNSTQVSNFTKERIQLRSKGMCEYIDKDGRCKKTTGLTRHHLVPRSDGGKNSLKNIILVCNYHRRILHGLVVVGQDCKGVLPK